MAATYTVAAGSSTAAIQTILNTAGSVAGNTVYFSAGAYSLSTMLRFPCASGTIYTGPYVGIVTQTNLPTAVLTSQIVTDYAVSTNSNGTTLTGDQGCTIQYLRFSGTQGGILVYHPASGILIQQNAFDNNNPPAGGASSNANIYLDGQNGGFTPADGVQYISILWNTFFNNCAAIRVVAYPDSGGSCAATFVNAYNNYLTWSNNTINLTEQGLKLSEQGALGISSLNAVVENNNMQGNSRIMIETQQDTNGVATYSHNAFYQPFNPSYNTFELSMPEYTPSISPTHTASDDVFIGNVLVTYNASGGHYGIGLEFWGAGSIATYNLFQGGNGPDTCAYGWYCTGWQICLGEAFTNANISNNYFSGHDVWTGTPNALGDAVTYEDGASASNPGLNMTENTVVETSTTIPTEAPTISVVSATTGPIVTLSDADTNRGLSIFYTTDGTTPAIFGPGGAAGTSKVYSAPFAVAQGTTVHAIASWGQGANQGIVFPSFGYVPSSMVTALAGSGRSLVSAYLRPKGSASTIAAGGTLQFTAYGVYSDGSTGVLPDAQGHAVTAWNTSNHKIAKISSKGHATAMAGGRTTIEATIGNLQATPYTVTVGSGVTPAAAAAIAQPAQAALSLAAGPAVGPAPSAPGPPLADQFLGPFWNVVTPAGGVGAISNSHLFLGVPGGANHDAGQAVRVVQTIGKSDFDVSIKIDSPLVGTDGNTSQGLMVMSDSQDFITFAVATDGARIGLSIRSVTGGAATPLLEDTDFSQYQNPMYLRLAKTGSAYVAFYSIDGLNWSQALSFSFSRSPTSVGPFASNYSDTPANAVPVVMSVNWFDVQQ